MDSKLVSITIIGILILSVGVSGCTDSNGSKDEKISELQYKVTEQQGKIFELETENEELKKENKQLKDQISSLKDELNISKTEQEKQTSEPDYKYEYESNWVTVKYTDAITADEAELTAILLGGRTLTGKVAEYGFGATSIKVWIHVEDETEIIRIETGFDSEHEITSRNKGIYETIIGKNGTLREQAFDENIIVKLLSSEGEVIRTIKN